MQMTESVSSKSMPLDLTSSSDADCCRERSFDTFSPKKIDFTLTIPKRLLINFYAYWLSIRVSESESFELCSEKDPGSYCRYIPPYLCRIYMMVDFVEEIYWESHMNAKHPQVALQTLLTLKQPVCTSQKEGKFEPIGYETLLNQAQTLFEMFLRAIGSQALRRYILLHQFSTQSLVRRFSLLNRLHLRNSPHTTNECSEQFADNSVADMLAIMSSKC